MNIITEPAAGAAISAAAWALHLPTVCAEASSLADDAARAGLTHRGFLAEVLSAEVDDRDARRRERRINEARFPRIKRLADFDLAAAPSIPPATFAAISALGRIDALVNELAEAADERMLSRVVARYGRLDLLCLDELGYVSLDPRGAELLFQVLHRARRKGVGGRRLQRPVLRVGRTFADPRLAAAVVDRLTFKAHIVETGTASYRLRATRAKPRGTKPPRGDQG